MAKFTNKTRLTAFRRLMHDAERLLDDLYPFSSSQNGSKDILERCYLNVNDCLNITQNVVL